MQYKHILAKSSKTPENPRPGETLFGHTQKVVESYRLIFGGDQNSPTRLAVEWLRFFKLSEADFSAFIKHGLLASALHDMGKANSGFQEGVRGKAGAQIIRHEHISGLILWLPEVKNCLNQISGIDIRIIFSAVSGHHLKCGMDTFAEPLNPDMIIFRIYPNLIAELLSYAGNLCDFTIDPSNLSIPEIWEFNSTMAFDPGILADELKTKELRKFKRVLKKDSTMNRMVMAVRTALILADSCGSAVVRENRNISEWINSAFSGIMDGGYIETNVIRPRIKEIQEKAGMFKWNDFQIASASLPKRALLLAPCGSGKTLAAWRWIQAQLTHKPALRVIFLYPTRATANEGFRDYVSWAPESDAGLIHGTSGYDLDGMFDQPEDERSMKNFSAEDRMYALGYWQRKIFSATVDQFLGFMQQAYQSVCMMPILADSVVVLDEIHSFDKSLFSALKLFLKNFDVPVLCMTASLPKARRDDLVNDYGLTLFPTETDDFVDLEKKSEMPRYRVEILQDECNAEQIASGEIASGQPQKILWVVNTVTRCQQLARKFNALCYHSRFKLEDRKDKHRSVIKAFQQKGDSVLAITTQVCEMSLDLDADILVSETAPITAMIQRMGRCNRHSKPEDRRLGVVYFYKPADEKPYSPQELSGLDRFLTALDGKTANQKILEDMLETCGPDEIEVEKYSAFLENGPWSVAGDQRLRDESGYTVNALLSDDIAIYYEFRKKGMPVDGLFVPVPKKFARRHPKLGRFVQVAESSHYDPNLGFLDYPQEYIL